MTERSLAQRKCSRFGTWMSDLVCILPDSVSYHTLRQISMEICDWKRGGRILNGGQLMMARNAFKPSREKSAKGPSGLRNEHRPHEEQKNIKTINSVVDMMDLD